MVGLESRSLPPPLMTSEPGSFARHTIVERKPQIISRVVADHDYPEEILRALDVLLQEILSEPVRPLREDADDIAFWHAAWSVQAGKGWLDLPWYFAETYFYRRLLEATRFLQPGAWQGIDPFAPQKRAQEAQAIRRLASAWPSIEGLPTETRFEVLLHAGLWGNRADLSNITVTAQAHDGLSTHTERHLILIDHTAAARELLSPGIERVAFICDNVGADSLFDLALADFCLRTGWASHIDLHLKDRPFFVSDAMPDDIRLAVGQIAESGPALAELGERLQAAASAGALRLLTDPFWSRSLAFHEMPPPVAEELQRAQLIILKGDVNYRRLLDDRHWPPETPIESITRFFPRPYLVSRTLKGEIIAGLQPGQAAALSQEDPTWLINGRRGLLQLVGASPPSDNR